MIALGECEVLGTERHVTDKWIKIMKMEKDAKHFLPICPKKSCCDPSEMVNIGLLCSGGGIAKPVCQPNCNWTYDCTQRTFLPGENETVVPPTGAKAFGDESELDHVSANSDSDFEFAETVSQAKAGEYSIFADFASSEPNIQAITVLFAAVVVIVVMALVILIVILVRLRLSRDY